VTSTPTPGPLRAVLRRLATGLIAYGVIGLVLALVGLIAVVWAGARLDAVGGRVETQIAAVVETLDRTSVALADAGTSATSFSVTMERTPPVVRQTAQAIADVRTDLRSAQNQFSQLVILGRQPLGGVAESFGRMAANLDGLDERLDLIATDLESNRTALVANATSLSALGARLGLVADDLRGGVVEEGFADLRSSATVLALVLLVWMTIPAAGALWLGWWLRREVGGSSDVGRQDED
jgi:hypothetical protein